MHESAVSEIQVSYTAQKHRAKVTSAQQAAEVFKAHWNNNTIELLEESKMLLLNRASEVLGIYPLAKGGVASVIVDVRIVLSIALKANACGIIIAHNHPSGSIMPSDADIRLTRKLKEGAALLELELVDHLIITQSSYFSICENFKG